MDAHEPPSQTAPTPSDAHSEPDERRPRLSVVVITQNVEHSIAECLDSVAWADEIVVVDSHSTDATRDICRRYTDKVHERTYRYAADQKNFGIRQATGRYVLILDADERVSPELAAEIPRVLSGPEPADVYCIPRRLMFRGRHLRFGGEYPHARPRLFRNGAALYRDQRAHAPLEYGCREVLLRGDLVHHSFRDLSDMLRRIDTFSTRRAQDLVESGRRIRWYDFLWPLGEFVHRYVLRGGFRDGMLGLFYCAVMSLYVLALYAKAWLAQHPEAQFPDALGHRDGA